MKMYRGMSKQELINGFKTGRFVSNGSMNAQHAEGSTCMAGDSGIAAFYAARAKNTYGEGFIVEFEVPDWWKGFDGEGYGIEYWIPNDTFTGTRPDGTQFEVTYEIKPSMVTEIKGWNPSEMRWVKVNIDVE